MLSEFLPDLAQFEEVPSPHTYNGIYRLSFSRGDQLSQNDSFHKKLDGRDAFRLRISPDGRMLAMDTEGDCNLTFTPSGVRTHHPLGALLRQRGLEAPLSYRMSWSDDLHCWIGQYDGLPSPPAPKKVPPTPKPRQRKA